HREIDVAGSELLDAVDGARRGDHREPHRAGLPRKILREPLHELLVAASLRPDRNLQRDGVQHVEGDADPGSKQQQAGGDHQQYGTLLPAAAWRNLVRAGHVVRTRHRLVTQGKSGSWWADDSTPLLQFPHRKVQISTPTQSIVNGIEPNS